jgi:hypothetical protein
LQKRKNTFEAKEGSEQRKKSREDARPQKVMHGSTKPLGVVVLGIVIKCVPTKPHKHQGSKQKQEKRQQSYYI